MTGAAEDRRIPLATVHTPPVGTPPHHLVPRRRRDFWRKIAIAQPNMDGNEAKYLLDCVTSGWVSSAGPYVKRFESEFRQLLWGGGRGELC
jgi:hypothetical protein